MTAITEEMLTAYVDGEANAEDRAAVEAALERDEDLRMTLERYRALQAEIDRSFSPVIAEPPPPQLLAAARGSSGGAAGRRFSARAWWTPVAMAASVAAGFFAAGLFVEEPNGPALAAGASVTTALDRLADGARQHDVLLVASYQGDDGQVCRSFKAEDGGAPVLGLACLAGDGGWRLVALDPAAPEDVYLPAGEAPSASGVAAAAAAMRVMTAEETDAFIASRRRR